MSETDDSASKSVAANTTNTAGFTEGETKFLLVALKHVKDGQINFNMDAVAAELGMKDGGSARARWNTIKRTKIGSTDAPAGGVDKTAPSKKKAALKKVTFSTAESGDGEETPTPKKRGRKTNAEKATVSAEAAENVVKTEAEEPDEVVVEGGLRAGD